jgi:hypothetical protein
MQWQHEMFNSFEYCRVTANFYYFAAEVLNKYYLFLFKNS